MFKTYYIIEGVIHLKFKDNLKKHREAAGYQQAKDFAAQLGIGYTTYMGYENRGAWPSQENLIKIAAALHVSIDELLGYEGKSTDWIESKLKPALNGTVISVDGIQRDGKIILSYNNDSKTRWAYSLEELRQYYDAAERQADFEKGKRVSEILYKTLLELALKR